MLDPAAGPEKTPESRGTREAAHARVDTRDTRAREEGREPGVANRVDAHRTVRTAEADKSEGGVHAADAGVLKAESSMAALSAESGDVKYASAVEGASSEPSGSAASGDAPGGREAISAP